MNHIEKYFELKLTGRKIEKYTFEFKLPPRSQITDNLLTINKTFYHFNNLKFTNGSIPENSTDLSFYIHGRGFEITAVLPSVNASNFGIFVYPIEIHLLCNGTSKHIIRKDMHKYGTNVFGYPIAGDIWKTNLLDNEACVWDDCIQIVRLVFCIRCEFAGECNESSPPPKIGFTDLEQEALCGSKGLFPREFLCSNLLSDVQLICGKVTFPAHRIILSCQSSVFKSMFEHTQMKESVEGRVLIKDINPEIFKLVLQQIYTGSTGTLRKHNITPQNQIELFEAADKYDIQPLKIKCINQMIRNITIENAVEIYAVGSDHAVPLLINKALQIIKINKEKLKENYEMFQEICKRYPSLMMELINND